MPIDFEESIVTEPIKPVIEPTAEEILTMEKAKQIEALGKKFSEYPDFVAMSDTEKLGVLIGAKITAEEEADLELHRIAFEDARKTVLESQRLAGLAEIEVTRVKVYKEKLALEQKWSNPAGTWELP